MSDTMQKLASLAYHEDQRPMFSPCFELVGMCGAPLVDAADGYAAAYASFAARAAADLAWWRSNAMKTMRPWSSRAERMLPFWLKDDVALAQPIIGLTAQGGPPKPGCGVPMLDFYHEQIDATSPRGAIRFALEPSVATDPDALFEWACNAFADYPMLFGWGGYAWAWHTDSSDVLALAERVLPPWLRRHPGMGLGDFMPSLFVAPFGLLTVSWLTFVGAEPLAQLGGVDAVRSSLPDTATVRELPSKGIVIRACEAPLVGDVNRQELADPYREVGRVVDAARLPSSSFDDVNLLVWTGEEKNDWLARFFPEQGGQP